MLKVFKKISIYVSIIMLICFIGVVVSAPFAVKGIIAELNNVKTSYETKEASTNITKAIINVEDYCYAKAKQSTNGKFYVEVLNSEYSSNTFSDIKADIIENENIARLNVYQDYTIEEGSFTVENIKKAMISDIIYIPDVVIYIPENIEVEIKGNRLTYEDLINNGIDFANKADIEAQLEAERLKIEEQIARQEAISMQNDVNVLRDEMYEEISDVREEVDMLRTDMYNNMTSEITIEQ